MIDVFLSTRARIAVLKDKHCFLLLLFFPLILSSKALVLSRETGAWHQCSKQGERSRLPSQASLCHMCLHLPGIAVAGVWCPQPLWDLTSLAGGRWRVPQKRKQLQVANVQPKLLQHKEMENAFLLTQVFVSSAPGNTFCLKEGDRIRAWLWKHLLGGWWGMHRGYQAPGLLRECRIHFPQERFSNLPLASSQIEITRKYIKERINQIERLCSN